MIDADDNIIGHNMQEQQHNIQEEQSDNMTEQQHDILEEQNDNIINENENETDLIADNTKGRKKVRIKISDDPENNAKWDDVYGPRGREGLRPRKRRNE
eukprot:1500697-Ditylum_brightwellii.AAC.1